MSGSPLILFVGGHDPSGGAGLQADIETAAAFDCQACSLVTCLTTQDSRDVQALHPQPAAQFARQLDLLLADVQPRAVKIGLLGDAAVARVLADRLTGLKLPVILDPVLAAGGGSPLAGRELVETLRDDLLPLTTLLTPNRYEARRLSGQTQPDRCARSLMNAGCQGVLLTGADESEGERVHNILYHAGGRVEFEWPLLPHSYHGSGCTLASACACQVAQGQALPDAARVAQQFTQQALAGATRPGRGQHLPRRRQTP